MFGNENYEWLRGEGTYEKTGQYFSTMYNLAKKIPNCKNNSD